MSDRLPPLTLLEPSTPREVEPHDFGPEIVKAAGEHGVELEVVGVHYGPQVVRYLVRPGIGILPRRVEAIQEALTLRVGRTVRYAGPDGTALALEVAVPAEDRSTVRLRDLVEHGPALVNLGIAVGVEASGSVLSAPLSRMPHLLIGGATGMGKSVFLNAILASLLLRNTPADLSLTMIDPKRVELAAYARLPHLARPIVTDVTEATAALRSVAAEMDDRYARMEKAGVKNIGEWNDKATARWGRHVVVIDELADLMMSGSKKAIEEQIVRIAQLGRAAGFHLVLATQYPKREVITSLIKQNVPTQIAFTVNDHTASNLIVGASGAERLTGDGDALFAQVGSREPIRVQTPFVPTEEIERLVQWWWEADAPNRLKAETFDRLKARRLETEKSDRETAVAAEGQIRERYTAAPVVDLERDLEPVMAPRDLLRLEMVEEIRQRGANVMQRLAELEEQNTALMAIIQTQGSVIAMMATSLGLEPVDA